MQNQGELKKNSINFMNHGMKNLKQIKKLQVIVSHMILII